MVHNCYLWYPQKELALCVDSLASFSFLYLVINVPKSSANTYVYCKDGGSVVDGEESMFNPMVKIETERAKIKTETGYVHLRFCYNNKYWQKNTDDDTVVAVSTKTEEDTTKPSCTLFEPTVSSSGVYFSHVPTGRRVMMNSETRAFYIDKKSSVGALFGFKDWSTLVKLPTHVAFKGDNGKYLQSFYDDHNYLKFKSDDPNYSLCGYTVSLMRDGHVRIKADNWGMFWRRSPNWIWADSTDVTANNKDTLFWPVKIDENTIALRNAGNNRFCQRLTTDGMEDCLNAATGNMAKETRLELQELVAERNMYNVRYRMEDARIYDEKPYLAGTNSAINNGDEEDTISVAITFTDEKSYTFTRSVSVTAGVKATIKAGLPGIVNESIEVSAETTMLVEWDTTKTTSVQIEASNTVKLPPRSKAAVSYVATKGTCDVPFSYTQQDRSSVNGAIVETEQIDGVYTGVNYYNFNFVVGKTEPL